MKQFKYRGIVTHLKPINTLKPELQEKAILWAQSFRYDPYVSPETKQYLFNYLLTRFKKKEVTIQDCRNNPIIGMGKIRYRC